MKVYASVHTNAHADDSLPVVDYESIQLIYLNWQILNLGKSKEKFTFVTNKNNSHVPIIKGRPEKCRYGGWKGQPGWNLKCNKQKRRHCYCNLSHHPTNLQWNIITSQQEAGKKRKEAAAQTAPSCGISTTRITRQLCPNFENLAPSF